MSASFCNSLLLVSTKSLNIATLMFRCDCHRSTFSNVSIISCRMYCMRFKAMLRYTSGRWWLSEHYADSFTVLTRLSRYIIATHIAKLLTFFEFLGLVANPKKNEKLSLSTVFVSALSVVNVEKKAEFQEAHRFFSFTFQALSLLWRDMRNQIKTDRHLPQLHVDAFSAGDASAEFPNKTTAVNTRIRNIFEFVNLG